MNRTFYRIVILVAGLALLLDGLALVDFLLHPLAQDNNFHSTLYRAATVLVLLPLTLLVGFLIIRRVPGNVVGPLLIVWSGTIAYHSIRLGIGPVLFDLYYAYDLVFGWFGLFLMFLHFPDGKIYPPQAARWIYRLLGFIMLTAILIFFSTQTLENPSKVTNLFFLPGLEPYAGVILGVGLLLLAPILVLIPISLVLRYRKGSLLEQQQIKWLALFGGIFVIYSSLVGIVYPLVTGGNVMTFGTGLAGMIYFFSCGLFPALAIGISIIRYRLWDIDRILRRTLVYSILTVILTLIYLGSAVILQTAFAFFFPLGSSNFGIVLSTLAIAALFTPLRSRIQHSIDQRFFRKKYDAEQIIASFAATARSEFQLESLTAALIKNVEEALHPEGIGLWLNAPSKKKLF